MCDLKKQKQKRSTQCHRAHILYTAYMYISCFGVWDNAKKGNTLVIQNHTRNLKSNVKRQTFIWF